MICTIEYNYSCINPWIHSHIVPIGSLPLLSPFSPMPHQATLQLAPQRDISFRGRCGCEGDRHVMECSLLNHDRQAPTFLKKTTNSVWKRACSVPAIYNSNKIHQIHRLARNMKMKQMKRIIELPPLSWPAFDVIQGIQPPGSCLQAGATHHLSWDSITHSSNSNGLLAGIC